MPDAEELVRLASTSPSPASPMPAQPANVEVRVWNEVKDELRRRRV